MCEIRHSKKPCINWMYLFDTSLSHSLLKLSNLSLPFLLKKAPFNTPSGILHQWLPFCKKP